jgi:hypothetical protein
MQSCQFISVDRYGFDQLHGTTDEKDLVPSWQLASSAQRVAYRDSRRGRVVESPWQNLANERAGKQVQIIM